MVRKEGGNCVMYWRGKGRVTEEEGQEELVAVVVVSRRKQKNK